MANPYESTSGTGDPFKETAADAPLSYTIPGPPTDGFSQGLPPATMEAPYQGNDAHPATTVVADLPAEGSDGKSSIFSIGYYRGWFDVNTHQVLNRLTNALVPVCPPDYLQHHHWHFLASPEMEEEENLHADDPLVIAGVKLSRVPDLYGPLWISTTLCAVIAVTANVMSRIQYAQEHRNDDSSSKWVFDFTLIPTVLCFVYLYCFGYSAAMWGAMKWKHLSVSLPEVWALYGYSMYVFILVAILCMVHVTWIQWLTVLFGGAISTGYIVLNLWGLLKKNLDPTWFLGITGAIGAGHIVVILVLKLYFLRHD